MAAVPVTTEITIKIIESVEDNILTDSETIHVRVESTARLSGLELSEIVFPNRVSIDTSENVIIDNTISASGDTASIYFKLKIEQGIFSEGASIYILGTSYNFASTVPGKDVSSPFFHIDSVHPQCEIDINPGSQNDKDGYQIIFTFSEIVQNFDLDDISVSQAVGNLANAITKMDMDGKQFFVLFTPNSDIETSGLTIQLGNGYTDLAGNAGKTAVSEKFAIDTRAPTADIALNDVSLTQGESLSITFTFSEAVQNFSLADIGTDQSLGSFGNLMQTDVDGKVYSVIFSPNLGIEASDIQIHLSNEYTDSAGNTGTAAVSPGFSIDTDAPNVDISVSDNNLTQGESLMLTVSFSEAVTNFSADDLLLGGVAVSLTQFSDVDAGKKFTAIYTPPTDLIDADNRFSLAAGSYTDVAGNAGAEAQSGNFSIDTVGKSFFGTANSDLLIGTAGADRISGVPQSGTDAGKGSTDLLLGLGGADVFLLGNHNTAFYNDGNNSSAGTKDFASIADFSRADGDKIEVMAGTYFFSATSVGKLNGAGLYSDTNSSGSWDAKDELIGFLIGVTPSSVSVAQDLILV